MQKILITLLSATLFALGSCSAQAVRQISVDSFAKAISPDGMQILDVRTAGEFQSGHLENALQADWTNEQQFRDRVQYIDKNKPVFVYCLSGGRSAAAAAWMQQHGYGEVYSMKGGINAWKQADKKLAGATATPQMTLAEYQEHIAGNGTFLVDFGAAWCPPCRKMEPILQALQQEAGTKFTLVKIDGGVHTNVMKEVGVEALPVFIVYKNGKETWRAQGIVSLNTLKAQL